MEDTVLVEVAEDKETTLVEVIHLEDEEDMDMELRLPALFVGRLGII